eukprot:CAMPEP_0205807686 /NCGR_PEP_ID=MMETSP0205-20121125/11453_1 /ASSEMBLY_ACC=CAM_ASM_000278 /TAXON_ID=36767 /ORGANISM="Euplotes focardii, Strain TN1" /LENGTH=30 /DNA_ID= /DNA_START= /DNA_END= /DNA_ORIENTATION=
MKELEDSSAKKSKNFISSSKKEKEIQSIED